MGDVEGRKMEMGAENNGQMDRKILKVVKENRGAEEERVKRRKVQEQAEDTRSKMAEKNSEDNGTSTMGTCLSSMQLSGTGNVTFNKASTESKVFIPKMKEIHLEGMPTSTYSFLCPHAGQFQCKITNIVFEMEEKGEVQYRIVSWDTHLLDGLGHMQPAGPLYEINCCEGSVSHLHLPHCETVYEENQMELTVANFINKVETLKPLKVTNTHVIIRIQDHTLFGLLKNMIHYSSPISAQVLLFYKEMTIEKIRNKLDIHLLPGNVPAEEVQKKHEGSTYFETSSRCQLIPGRKYKASCDPYEPQPKLAEFDCHYGPNHHPTFVVFSEAEDITVSVLDEDGMEVWEPHQVFMISEKMEKCQSAEKTPAEVHFVDKHMDKLIGRVTSVMEIADCLLSKKMITDETYDKIHTEKTPQEQMRILIQALRSGGQNMKDEFYRILKEKQPFLIKDLETGPSKV